MSWYSCTRKLTVQLAYKSKSIAAVILFSYNTQFYLDLKHIEQLEKRIQQVKLQEINNWRSQNTMEWNERKSPEHRRCQKQQKYGDHSSPHECFRWTKIPPDLSIASGSDLVAESANECLYAPMLTASDQLQMALILSITAISSDYNNDWSINNSKFATIELLMITHSRWIQYGWEEYDQTWDEVQINCIKYTNDLQLLSVQIRCENCWVCTVWCFAWLVQNFDMLNFDQSCDLGIKRVVGLEDHAANMQPFQFAEWSS